MNAPIVVGVDGSERALDAVRWAAREALLRNLPLHLVAVVHTESNTFGNAFTLGTPKFPDQRNEGRERLSDAHSVAAEVNDDSLTVTDHLARGHPVEALLEQSTAAAMLVVGSRGQGRWADGVLGSVSTATAMHARCPVAVIRGISAPGDPPLDGPVVVGVDGTENSEPAIAEAFETAFLHGVDVVAVHAWDDSHHSTAFRSAPDGSALELPAIETAELVVLAERLAGWKQKYPDVTVQRVVVRDSPAHQLIAESKAAQLVVVGRRGRGGFTSMLLGSTSRNLLHRAECPLLIVSQITKR
ncbi:universal stress protein [Rhodococcus sp. SRB_17]|nr:universal stress protein [Rhodococcus sp. SRB_17]